MWATKTIFELNKDIIETNPLTKFHDDRKINKNAPPPWWPCFSTTGIIFDESSAEFHKDWTINVASRVENAPPFGSHVFRANVTIFELIQDIKKTNLLTIFHEDWTINVASRVKKCPAPCQPSLPRYGSGRTDGKDGRKDGQRQNNIPPPMAGDNYIS
ncbi:hypothetical protein DPMN_164810 [Dreissena polymorpha]|uniref:Uncharacterized protein n=1 Tax=Dreissena polymorpha TaxID=45954 RepID=A0A9D4EYG8_DREPO|nr:hypothetical protein DPMN_164810 [Dreissena polymorpha]